MSSKAPPVPEENRSPRGTGDPKKGIDPKQQADMAAENPDKVGQQGNTKVNTTHQGYQQDR